MESSGKMSIRFELENEFGELFSQESTITMLPDIGISELERIGEKLNAFLVQLGYIRRNGYILMEDINEEECEALSGYLQTLRSEKEKQGGSDV